MPITMDDLTINIAAFDQTTLLSNWAWLIGPSRFPILVTAAGDAFLQDAESGEIVFLDAQSAVVGPVASSVEELQKLLTDRDFVVQHLDVQTVGGLLARGQRLGPGEVFSYEKPLVLGGEPSFDNIKPLDAAVHFSLLGQIHKQVHDLPPGTPITGLNIG